MAPKRSAASRFSGTIRIRGVNPYILISARRAHLLKPGWRKPMPVVFRVAGGARTKSGRKFEAPWRINLMPVGNGSFYLYLHEQVRRESVTGVGDRVWVELRFDDAYRNGPLHPMPSWFRLPLAQDPAARQSWRALPPSRQKEVLRYFAGLKSGAARARNVKRALNVLSGEVARFMGRTWRNGS